MDQIKDIYQGVLDGDMGAVRRKCSGCPGCWCSAADILQKGLIAAMGEVGQSVRRR